MAEKNATERPGEVLLEIRGKKKSDRKFYVEAMVSAIPLQCQGRLQQTFHTCVLIPEGQVFYMMGSTPSSEPKERSADKRRVSMELAVEAINGKRVCVAASMSMAWQELNPRKGKKEETVTFHANRTVRLDEVTTIELGPPNADWRVTANVLVIEPGARAVSLPRQDVSVK